jgi:hypothetical protein
MGRKYLLLFSILVTCFFSCGKDNTPPQNLIVGTWNLQQQHVVMNIDNVKQTDTVLAASATTYATAQFNKDGSYSSAAVYRPNSTALLQNPAPSSASTEGTYSYSANVFAINPGLAGWFSFGVGSTGPPTGVSSSIGIIQLDASHLTIHSTSGLTITTGTGPHVYNEVFDFYYTK